MDTTTKRLPMRACRREFLKTAGGELLIGRDPLDRTLDGERLWEALYPGKAQAYAEGRDPLTGADIANKVRAGRHTATGAVFIGFSNVDNALWDLRGKLLGQPAYRVIGAANREMVRVYWRPGEAKSGLAEARRQAREAFDRGYRFQKGVRADQGGDGGHHRGRRTLVHPLAGQGLP